MVADQIARSVWMLLALVLVGSGLLVRRLPRGKSFALVGAWLGIIVALTALIIAWQKMR